MDFLTYGGDGEISLNEDEKQGCKLGPALVSTKGDLNLYEAQNITKGKVWLASNKGKVKIDIHFANQLHKKLFEDVWDWAGKYRSTEKSVGVDPRQVRQKLYQTFGNFEYRLQNEPGQKKDILVWFHHQLTAIHPYPNGNGRWARILTNAYAEKQNIQIPTWGAKYKNDSDPKEQLRRQKYLDALREVDVNKDTTLLYDFMYH